MARIYKISDRIPVKIDDLTITISPLTIDQKTEIQQYMIESRLNRDIRLATKGVVSAIKYSVKGVSGIVDSSGHPYNLEFDSNGHLTDACVNDLLNLENHSKLALVCSSLIQGIPEEFVDEQGRKLEGVEFLNNHSEPAEKNG